MRRLDDQAEIMGEMAMNVTIIKGDVADIKQDMNLRVDKKDYKKLVRRVTLLERR